ncbi:hypothetical protein [Micromonospora aurantiaca (nom. illeg.)]|uniref:hypothetical protein n=1 Tax=Micromonospora aurantiaca (nom. illeg.) TaxID=47850 RepID=UPI00340F0A03
MSQETLNALQVAGLAVTLTLSVIALVLSWQNNRATAREARIAGEQLEASVVPVAMIQDSRLTWRGQELVVLSVRLRNVGAGPMLGLRIEGITLDRAALAFVPLGEPKADAVQPMTDVEQRLRFTEPPRIPDVGSLVLRIRYYDVLGHDHDKPLNLRVSAGSGSGTMTGFLPARITRRRA